jgi:type I restriction enzyme S subunit
MSARDRVAIAELAEVNPKVDLRKLREDTPVSFIPMSDVTESGRWVNQQERLFGDVRFGYTPFTEGDVLFAKITPCMENGKGAHAMGLRNGVGFGSTEFHVLRARGANSARFVYHWLQASTARTRALAYMGGSAGQQRVQADFFNHFRVPGFAPGEQSRIAEVLDTVAETIAKTEAVIAKLRQVRSGLLHDLFTRGLDRKGQLRGSIAHPEQFQDSPLGRVPREWDICLLDEVAVRGSGHTPAKDVPGYWNGGIKWVSLADSDRLDRIYIHQTDKEISELGIENSSAVKHPAGTVILSRDAGIGKSAILAEEMAVSQHFMAWRCGKRLHNVYLYYWLQHKKPQFEAIAMGSTIKTIGLPYFKLLRIGVPPMEEQRTVSEMMLTAEGAISAEEKELAKLHQLRAGLMTDLLMGIIPVPATLGSTP